MVFFVKVQENMGKELKSWREKRALNTALALLAVVLPSLWGCQGRPVAPELPPPAYEERQTEAWEAEPNSEADPLDAYLSKAVESAPEPSEEDSAVPKEAAPADTDTEAVKTTEFDY